MDMKDLKKLVDMIAASDINEFEFESGDDKVLIRRGQKNEYVTVASAPVQVPAPAPVAVAPTAAAAPAAAAPEAAAPVGDTINSPMVGSFYRKPSPDADAFVEVGSIVEAGQPLCIVEAMKMFNEIEAEYKCRVVEILKEDSQPVEYGEPLFRVERL